MEIILPPKEDIGKHPAVYMILFDEKWFYIGSSGNIKARINKWKHVLQTGNHFKSINIKKILPFVSSIKIIIIKKYKTKRHTLYKETELIQKNWDNPLLLNRCPFSDTPKNIRPYFGYEKPNPKPAKGTPDWMKPKKIALFTPDWELINVFESISAFCRYSKLKSSTVNSILNGKRGQPKKYKIKAVALDGSFVEPIIFTPKKDYRHNPNTKKPVIQLDKQGNIIAVHSFYKDAARAVGVSDKYIHMLLKNTGRGKFAKGYAFKYA